MDIVFVVLGSGDLSGPWVHVGSWRTYEEAQVALSRQNRFQYYRIDKVWEYPF